LTTFRHGLEIGNPPFFYGYFLGDGFLLWIPQRELALPFQQVSVEVLVIELFSF